jgi:hypothetical protein
MQDLVALDSEMVPDFLLLDSMDALAKRKKKMQNETLQEKSDVPTRGTTTPGGARDAGVEATRRAGVAGSGGGRSDGVSDGHGTRVPDSSTSKLQDLIALDAEMVPDILLLDSMDAHAKRKKMQN